MPARSGRGLALGAVPIALLATPIALALARPAAAQGAQSTEDAAAPGEAMRSVVEGLPVYAQSLAAERITLRAYVRAGRSTADGGQGRLSDLTAAWMVLGGTESLPGADFVAARKALDVEVSGSADRDLLTLVLRVEPLRLHPAVRLFADLLMYPAFDPSALAAAERQAGMAGEDTGRETSLAQLRAWLQLPEPPSAEPHGLHPPAPPGKTSLREAVARFHRDRVGSDTTVVVVEGPLVGVNLEFELRSAFLGFRRAAAPGRASDAAAPSRSSLGASVALREQTPGRSRLLVGRTGLPRGHPDWLAVEAGLVAVAGSDVTADLDAAGPISTRAGLDLPLLEPDLLVVDVTAPTLAVGAAAAAYEQAFLRLRDGRITSNDFERAKRFLAVGLLPPPDAGKAARAYALLEALGGGGRSPQEWWNDLTQLRRADVTRAAREHVR